VGKAFKGKSTVSVILMWFSS